MNNSKKNFLGYVTFDCCETCAENKENGDICEPMDNDFGVEARVTMEGMFCMAYMPKEEY